MGEPTFLCNFSTLHHHNKAHVESLKSIVYSDNNCFVIILICSDLNKAICEYITQSRNQKMDNIITNELIHDLTEMGHNEQDISNGVHDANIRLSWDINSFCLIYSRKNRTWCNGKIIDIL